MKMWIVALFDGLTKIAWFICVTYAACFFGKWWIMFLVVAVIFMGHSFTETYTPKKKDGENDV